MNVIKLEVPIEQNALARAADMLHGLAIDLRRELPKPGLDLDTPLTRGELDEAGRDGSETTQAEKDAASALLQENANLDAGTAPTRDLMVVPPGEAWDGVTPSVDADGLQWDKRIHGSAKLTLAKDGKWKKIRSVSADLVAKVEAELRAGTTSTAPDSAAGTTAPAPGPGNTAPAPGPETTAPPPAEEPTLYLLNGAEYTEEQLKESGWKGAQIAELETVVPKAPVAEMDFPALMARIREDNVSQEAVDAAVNKAGLAALPLLAANPEKVQAVADTLFG